MNAILQTAFSNGSPQVLGNRVNPRENQIQVMDTVFVTEQAQGPDQSGVTTTRRGDALSLPASTGTRSASGTIKVITREGQEKVYFGLAFARAG